MRNVLLKQDGMNGLVAKLIGFGTFNDSGTEDQAEESTANVILIINDFRLHINDIDEAEFKILSMLSHSF